HVDVRIIAATHQNLEKLVAEGKFREDLYHRLNVIRIHIPRLRDRSEDIPMLAEHFLQRAGHELSVEPKQLRSETAAFLQQLPWPGNVRQLENACRWLTVMASSREVLLTDLPPELRSPSMTQSHTAVKVEGMIAGQPQVSLGHSSLEWDAALSLWAKQHLMNGEQQILNTATPMFERVMILAALEHSQGKKRLASELLGWGRNTLTRKLKELGISSTDDEEDAA
ncbi:MAG: sigma 54-interacting transcriptional regulator, partial [Candidatus Saccharibacteria bacterium]|nr:sigma 54-interacting transcriptional regulator [Moraxellaceae bacterium]